MHSHRILLPVSHIYIPGNSTGWYLSSAINVCYSCMSFIIFTCHVFLIAIQTAFLIPKFSFAHGESLGVRLVRATYAHCGVGACMGYFHWLLSWLLHKWRRFSVPNLSPVRNWMLQLVIFNVMMTVAFSQNIVFSKLKSVTNNILHLGEHTWLDYKYTTFSIEFMITLPTMSYVQLIYNMYRYM